MKEAFQDDGEFSFNLDGFLEAAREVPWHMKKQYDKEPGFNQWYDEKVAEMQKMPMLRFTIKARNYSTKEGPVPVGATCEISLSSKWPKNKPNCLRCAYRKWGKWLKSIR
jgi:hypothetical protein